MGQALEKQGFDRATFLEWEATQEGKNEYFAGEVFAMVGARRVHVVVTLALASQLRDHLKGTRCSAFASDMKLEIATADVVSYPDVMVSCDDADRRADLALHSPCLIIEVLSKSTAATDRGVKFEAYRQIDALQDYLLVDIDRRKLELFTRHEAGWLLQESTAAQAWVDLRSVGLRLTVEAAFGDLADDGQAEQQGAA